ncbi:hypothetical protein ACWDRB_60820 [Nonomuraea sp. NPDC003707]
MRFFLPELIDRLVAELGVEASLTDLLYVLVEADYPAPAQPSGAPELGALDVIGLTDFTVQLGAAGLVIDGILDVVPGFEPRFPIPGMACLSVVVTRLGGFRLEINAEVGRLTIRGPSIALRFDKNVLSPVSHDDPTRFAEIELVQLGFLTVDTRGNVEFGAAPGGRLRFVTNNDPWRIGDSSLQLTIGELDIVLSDEVEGSPAVVLTDATLRFADDLDAKDGSGFAITLTGARIGPSGFSGTASALFDDTAVDDPLRPTHFTGSGAASLFGFEFGVTAIELEFRDNLPVRGAVTGLMILPYFEQAVGCRLGVGADGSFAFALTDIGGNGILTLTKQDLLEVRVTRFALDRTDGAVALTLSGELDLLAKPDQIESGMPSFRVDRFVVDSLGRVSLQGGWVDLDPAAALDLVGFVVTIDRLGLGFDQDALWVGVSGGVALVDGLPRGTVEELRITFPFAGGPPALALSGGSLQADIGGQIALFGSFALLDTPEAQGFAGDFSLALTSVGFALDGSMLAGVNPAERYPFLYVYIAVELPAGIPIGPTGISLFGFAGLFGYNVRPAREPGQSWYYDWYQGPPGPGVTQSTKWRPARDAFALGAGVTIGTADGYTIVARTLFVITLPSFLLLIEGRAGFLTQRTQLGAAPALRALIVIDSSDGVLVAVEAQYEFVTNVLFAHGLVEGYFPFHGGGWYVHLGQRDPQKRIVAEVLKKLFRADAYVMVDSTQVQFGGRIGYALDKAFGPVRLAVRAELSGDGVLSYHPVQLSAQLQLVGSIALSAFGIGLGLHLSATIKVRVATPFLLSLAFEATLDLPWPLPDPSLSFEVRWEERVAPPYPERLLAEAAARPAIGTETTILSTDRITEGVALDASLQLSFEHALSKSAPGRFTRLLGFAEPVFHRISPEYGFRYDLTSLVLERLAPDGAVLETYDLEDRLYGHWQLTPAGPPPSGPAPAGDGRAPAGTLLLLARTPFPYLESSYVQGTGTSPPAALPEYAPLPVTPPAETRLDLCSVLGVAGGLPSDGETATGHPDPATATSVLAAGAGVVCTGFPEVADGRITDPSGSPFGIEVRFPEDVVVTEIGVDPGPGGTVTVTHGGLGAQAPPPVSAPEDQPPPEPGPGPGRWCLWLAVLVTVIALVLAMVYGWWLPRPAVLTAAVLALLTAAVAVLWWWALRRCRPPGEAVPDLTRVSTRFTRAIRAAGAIRVAGAEPVAVDAAEPAAAGLLADRVTIVSAGLSCKPIVYVDAAARRDQAEAIEVNALRAQAAAAYAGAVWQTLTEEAFLFRPNSRYRISLALDKIGRDAEIEHESHQVEFRTRQGPPADLRPYVLEAVPGNVDVPVFRTEEVGVRFLATHVRQMYERAAEIPLTLEIRDPAGRSQSRATAWRKAENHIDRGGELALLAAVNQLYGTAFPASGLPRDDMLVAAGGALPAATTFDAAVMAAGAESPLFTFRFRTGRYLDLKDWAAACDPRVAALADPGVSLAGDGPVPISEPSLLPLLREPPPARPVMRRADRPGRQPLLVLDLPEPLAWRRVEVRLRRTDEGRPAARDYRMPFEAEPVIPLARYVGPAQSGEAVRPVARLAAASAGLVPTELAKADGTSTSPEVPVRVRWLEDGSRAFIEPVDPAERLAGRRCLLEVRYARALPDPSGQRVVETVVVPLEMP